MLKGHCECGRITFTADDSILDFSHCHCSQCRRLHGAAFATFAGIARESFSLRSGKDDVRIYASSARNDRWFCGHCGSTILVDAKDEPEALYLSMSTIEGNPLRPQAYHAYVGSMALWHEINDDAPQFNAEPPEDSL